MSLLGFIGINSSYRWNYLTFRIQSSLIILCFDCIIFTAKLKLYFIINLMSWLLVYPCTSFILTTWKTEVRFTYLRLKCLVEAYYIDYISGQRIRNKIWSNLFCPEWQPLLRDWLGTNQQMVAIALCITPFLHSLIITGISPSFSVVLNFISTHECYPFSNSLPHPIEREWVSSSVWLAACWLKPQHCSI